MAFLVSNDGESSLMKFKSIAINAFKFITENLINFGLQNVIYYIELLIVDILIDEFIMYNFLTFGNCSMSFELLIYMQFETKYGAQSQLKSVNTREFVIIDDKGTEDQLLLTAHQLIQTDFHSPTIYFISTLQPRNESNFGLHNLIDRKSGQTLVKYIFKFVSKPHKADKSTSLLFCSLFLCIYTVATLALKRLLFISPIKVQFVNNIDFHSPDNVDRLILTPVNYK
ncbi:Hypothetical_protein [Hexamita inflata]|uniref:Hypothetical_protein n=1 Tax=Hexamita inflata TaxID=28002 RepID=A0ABP1HQW0_9EUKA